MEFTRSGGRAHGSTGRSRSTCCVCHAGAHRPMRAVVVRCREPRSRMRGLRRRAPRRASPSAATVRRGPARSAQWRGEWHPVCPLVTASVRRRGSISGNAASSGLAQNDAQERRRIEIRDHRRRRSSTSVAVLSVRLEGLGGSFRSRSRRVALRTSSEGAPTGMIRATGLSAVEHSQGSAVSNRSKVFAETRLQMRNAYLAHDQLWSPQLPMSPE